MNSSIPVKVLLIGALAVGASLTAHSASDSGSIMPPASVEIRFDDLNLAATSGMQTLRRRIQDAAGRVCSYLDLRQPRRASEFRTCVRDASDKALAQVSLPIK